jgi:diaminopimelate epimerase
VLSLICALPRLIAVPLGSVTVRFEKVASRLSVNVSITSCGAALMVEPADGLACASEACACAAAALTAKKSNDRATMENRIARIPWKSRTHPSETDDCNVP